MSGNQLPNINSREDIFDTKSPLKHLAKAAAVDSHRLNLNGVHITSDGTRAVATNGHRMHVLPICGGEEVKGKIFGNPKSIKANPWGYSNGEVQDEPVGWQYVYGSSDCVYYVCAADIRALTKESRAMVKAALETAPSMVSKEVPENSLGYKRDVSKERAKITEEYKGVAIKVGDRELRIDRGYLMDVLAFVSCDGNGKVLIGTSSLTDAVYFHNTTTGAHGVVMAMRGDTSKEGSEQFGWKGNTLDLCLTERATAADNAAAFDFVSPEDDRDC